MRGKGTLAVVTVAMALAAGCAGNEGCPTGFFDCGGICADILNDPANCGSCGAVCAQGHVCSLGSCVLSCQEGFADCTGVCRDLMHDQYNCGTCGLTCAAGYVCDEGTCRPDCPDGYTNCSGICKNLSNDPSNCGECANACSAGEVCASGSCLFACPGDYVDCSGACADLQTDHSHCGACGDACLGGQICEAGACVNSCLAGLTLCSGACRDLMRDPENCGSCASRCADGEVCYDGTCTTSCPGGFTNCSDTCRDIQSDRLNCGACDNVCEDGQVCISGACEWWCASPLVVCDLDTDGDTVVDASECTNLASDPDHCGTCGNDCPLGQACVSGTCRDVDTSCGDGILQSTEEYEPPPGPFTSVSVDYTTCLWDFSSVAQLYCNGTCTYAGSSSCDSADADLFCKLKTGNPASTASSYTIATALAVPGFACPSGSYGVNVGPLPLRGVTRSVYYQDSSILANHGSGSIISTVTCTDP